MKIENLIFHDATIYKISNSEDQILIFCDIYNNCEKEGIKITINQYSKIIEDGKEIKMLNIIGENGDIMEIDFIQGKIELLVTWENYETKESITKFYEIECSDAYYEII